ncbi:MAG: hypothetical protein Q8O67_22285 [Deltaproteobacteria bacterium]|nr:hypothetical protein [Deltaproteobacteria bacterium]
MAITTVRSTTTPILQPVTPAVTPGTQTTATTTTTTPAGGTVPAGGGNVVNAKPITAFGLQGNPNVAAGTSNRFARDASFDTYAGNDAGGAVSRGFIKVDAQPLANGCRIEVASFHGSHNDKMTLTLLAEVLDTQSNQLRTITLSVLAKSEVMNGTSYRGKNYFDLNYDDVNKWLQAKNPALKLVPGHTNLAVAAKWDIGHQAGGFGRGGVFRIPPPLGTQSIAAIRSTGAATSTEQTDLPLDMQVAFPPTLLAQVPQLKPTGSIQSRLESELKGNTSKKEMVAAVHEMYRLAELSHTGNDREIEKMLGKDWTIETVNRYWLKDTGAANQEGKAGAGYFKGFRVDGNGLPMQDPMRDSYMDDGNLMMTRHEGAIRLRTNQQATVVNVKPGGGRRDPQTQITQRIEVGVELNASANTADAAAAMQKLASGTWSGTVFNHAQKEVAKLDAGMNLSTCLVPWLDVTQDRHKFTVKNKKTGVEIELSLDFVKAKTLRPGHADAAGVAREVEFCTLEAELDHLQLQSANQSTFVAAGSVQQGTFNTDADQDTWLKASSAAVTMDIDPRLHELKDLENKSFRSTGSYKSFEGVTAKLVPALFKSGLGEGRQKAAHAAALLGLVSFDDTALTKNIHERIAGAGFVVTPALATAIDAAVKLPRQRLLLDQGLSSGTAKNVAAWLQQGLGAVPALEYDLGKTKARLQGSLEALGFVVDATTTALLDTMTVQKMPPATFEQHLARLPQLNDVQMLAGIAAALGVPAPALKPDVASYLKRAEVRDALGKALETAAVDKASVVDVEAFLLQAAGKGHTLFEIRQLLATMASSPQVRLQQVATTRGLTVPALKASVDALVRQLEPYLKQQQLVMTPSLKKLLEKVASTRDVTASQQFVQSLAQNAVDTAAAEAKRQGMAAPTLDRDWVAIDGALTPTLKQHHVAYSADLQKLVRSAVDAGVPSAVLQRAFQYLGNQSLAQALKTAGVYLVGVKIPDVDVDKASLGAALSAAYQGYTGVFPSWTSFVDDALKAGLTPAQVAAYAQQSVNSGSLAAARAYPQLMSLPNVPVDVAGLCSFVGTRHGAQWSPAIDAFVKQHFALASSSVGVARLYQLRPRDIAVSVATAAKVAVPAGI